MPPQAVSLGLFVIEEAIKLVPGLYSEIQALFTKPDPTPADWEALRARVLAKSYRDFVPETALPTGEQ
jgi:hypothetical protein